MGGGDLNMKKHFHPLTRENLERVWKAEQKRDEELRRIEERKKEIAEERARDELLLHASKTGIIQKRQERLDWMYAGCRVNNEDFLLGKEVTDEFVENAAKERKEEVVKKQMGVTQNLQTVDLARKIREDPLFLIKKREAAATKSVIENSARVKQLVQMSASKTNQTAVSQKDGYTPRTSKLTRAPWETPSSNNRDVQSSRRSERKNSSPPSKIRHSTRRERDDNSSECEGGVKSSRRNRKRSRSRSSSADAEEQLKRMMENAKWREEHRTKSIRKEKLEEEAEKLEEDRSRLQGKRKSAYTMMDDVKMGKWSSRRYVKR